MWYVYVLQSRKDHRYYIGMTNDLFRRVCEHNSGKNKSTRNRKPFKLIYHEVFSDKISAVKRELQIKKYKGGEAFKKLLQSK